MKVLTSAGCLLAFWVSASGSFAQESWSQTFDADRPDHPPSGFSLAAMRQPGAGRWTVQRQGTQGYLVHQADPSTTGYALAIAEAPATDDAAASARLRFVSGARTGGLVWRYLNDQNFYALVLDIAHQDLALYRVTSGNRINIDVEDALELDPQAWHTLKVQHVESEIRVYLGGIRVFNQQDRRDDRRAHQPGRTGLLASGHSEVWFDDVKIEPKKGRH